MLVVSETLMAAIETGVRQRLVRRVAEAAGARLLAAGAPRDPDELRAIADAVQRLAEQHRIFQEANLHTLMTLRLAPQWCDPLPALAHLFLTRDGFDETARVEQFRQALLQPPKLTLIDLDSLIGPPPR